MCFKTTGGLVNFMTGNVNTRPIYSSQIHHCHVHNLGHCDISPSKSSGWKVDQIRAQKFDKMNQAINGIKWVQGNLRDKDPFSNWEDEYLHYLRIQSDGLGLDSKM